MTNTNLERAKEIKSEIEDLRRALSQITRGKLFELDQQGCMRTYADPFLATLENDLKVHANSEVLKKINTLEEEFKSL